MTTYNLSVVQLCPAEYKAPANAIAEALGYSKDNLSVELIDQHGAVWWGCHAWWLPSALEDAFLSEDVAVQAILQHVITSVQLDAVPHEHWMRVLGEHGLTVVHHE